MLDAKDEIKSRLDIADVLAEYITLKPAGANFQALCPFHNEKTPSFTVSRERQRWHCFGCGEDGDIFSFIMKVEGLEFPEAMRILAAKAGVELKRQDPKLISQKTKLLDVGQAAAEFFRQNLKSPPGKMALEYLQKRGLTDETMEKFQLGYAPESWDALLNFLKAKGFKEQDIEFAGLITQRQAPAPNPPSQQAGAQSAQPAGRRPTPGYYDRFRGRVMFPIGDIHGNIVGFTGRILKEDPLHPAGKYVNTPETAVYSKGHLLYALDKAKAEIRKKDFVILVEGQMDAITSHQHGFANTVAFSGTAITESQIELLRRHTKNFIFTLDADAAGQMATDRGDEVKGKNIRAGIVEQGSDRRGLMKTYIDPKKLAEKNISIKVVEMPGGKDPDEYIKNNPEKWPEAIAKAKPIIQYYFDKAFQSKDLNNIDDRRRLTDYLLDKISKIYDKLERDFWAKNLSQKLEVNEEILREELEKIISRRNDEMRRAGSGRPDRQGAAAKPAVKNRNAELGERLVSLMLKFPEHLKQLSQNLELEILTSLKLRQLAESLVRYYNNDAERFQNNGFDLKGFYRELEAKDKAMVDFADFLLLLAENEFDGWDSEDIGAEMKVIVRQLNRDYCRGLSKELEKEMQAAQRENRQEDEERLTAQFAELTEKLGALDREQ